MPMPASDRSIARKTRRSEMRQHATQSSAPMPTEVAFVEGPATPVSGTLRGAPLLCFHLLQKEFWLPDILLWLHRAGRFLPGLSLNSHAPGRPEDPIQSSCGTDRSLVPTGAQR